MLFFSPLNIGLIELSRSIFVLLKNHSLITQFYVLGFFVNFWVIYGYVWKEIVFLKGLVELGEIINI